MFRKLFLALIFFLPLGGCALFDTWISVTQIHTLPPTGNNQSIAILPAASQENPDSASFVANAASLAQFLREHGYRPVTEKNNADLIATLSYRSPGCTTTNRSTPMYSSHFNGRNWVQVQTGSHIVVDRACTLTAILIIYKGSDFRNGILDAPLYTANATAVLPTDDIERIAPLLIRAFFVDFPGTSGETNRRIISDSAPAPHAPPAAAPAQSKNP